MGRGFPLLVTYFPHLPVQPILRALLLPAPCQPRHRGLLGHHWLLSGCPVPGLYRLLLQPQHQLCHPVAGVRRPGKCLRGGGEISEPRPKGRIGGEQNGTPCGELVRAKARRPETPDLLRVWSLQCEAQEWKRVRGQGGGGLGHSESTMSGLDPIPLTEGRYGRVKQMLHLPRGSPLVLKGGWGQRRSITGLWAQAEYFGGGGLDQGDSEAMRRQGWERRRGWSGLRARQLGAEGLVSDGRRWVTGLGRPPV